MLVVQLVRLSVCRCRIEHSIDMADLWNIADPRWWLKVLLDSGVLEKGPNMHLIKVSYTQHGA